MQQNGLRLFGSTAFASLLGTVDKVLVAVFPRLVFIWSAHWASTGTVILNPVIVISKRDIARKVCIGARCYVDLVMPISIRSVVVHIDGVGPVLYINALAYIRVCDVVLNILPSLAMINMPYPLFLLDVFPKRVFL